LTSQFRDAARSCGGQALEFLEETVHGGHEIEQSVEALAGVLLGRAGALGFGEAFADDLDRGVEFPLFALLDNDAEEFPDIFDGLEVLAAVAEDRRDADDAPAEKFAEAGGDIGAGDAKSVRDLFGGDGAVGEIEESVDLGDGAVDAPASAHLAPMKDEALGDGREVRWASFFHFCYDRIYCIGGMVVKRTERRGCFVPVRKTQVVDFGRFTANSNNGRAD
jgi:hypothetical protein